MEVCHNPLKPDCESNDIVVYIQVGSERFPICRQCWSELAESSVEWGEDGLKVAEEKAPFIQDDQANVSPENGNKKAVYVKKEREQHNGTQNEPDAGERFLEELSKSMKSA